MPRKHPVLCVLCGKPVQRPPPACPVGRPAKYCPGCSIYLAETTAHTPYEDVGYRPAWTHYLTPVDLLTPRQLQRLHGDAFVRAANAIIRRILDDDGGERV